MDSRRGDPAVFRKDRKRRLGNKVHQAPSSLRSWVPRHLRTGKPIVYTSADSVFQIAAHEDIIPVPSFTTCVHMRGRS